MMNKKKIVLELTEAEVNKLDMFLQHGFTMVENLIFIESKEIDLSRIREHIDDMKFVGDIGERLTGANTFGLNKQIFISILQKAIMTKKLKIDLDKIIGELNESE